MKYGTMVYLTSGNNVLMIKKGIRKGDPNSGYLTFPGGKLEDYEKGLENSQGRLESAVRENLDETGIKVLNPVLRGVILFDNRDRVFENWKNPDDFYVYIYSATKFEGKPKESDEGKPYTVPLNGIRDVPSNAGDKKMYDWLLDGRNFIGVIKHKGKEIDKDGTFVDFFN